MIPNIDDVNSYSNNVIHDNENMNLYDDNVIDDDDDIPYL